MYYPYLFLFFSVFLLGCSSNDSTVRHNQGRLTVIDDLGRELKLDAHPIRVMALAPSMTEYLALICPKEQIVGRTQNCDFPTWVKDLQEVVNYPNLDFEQILKLKPDLILTHKGMTPESDILKLAEFGIPTYVFLIDSLVKICKSAERIGIITGNYKRGKFVKDSLEQVKIQILEEVNVGESIIGLMNVQPLFAFGKGSLVDEMIQKVGLSNAIDSSFISFYPQLDEEYLIRKNPTGLFVTSSISWDTFFLEHPNLKILDAYKYKKIYKINGNYISREGPRIMYGLRELCRISDSI